MHPNETPQSTPAGPVSRARAHVVYDKATGTILHVHHTVEFDGGAPAREGPEDRARRHARAGPEHAVVEVDPSEVNHRRPIHVDPASGKVVPKP